jgi:hypothetical protein
MGLAPYLLAPTTPSVVRSSAAHEPPLIRVEPARSVLATFGEGRCLSERTPRSDRRRRKRTRTERRLRSKVQEQAK